MMTPALIALYLSLGFIVGGALVFVGMSKLHAETGPDEDLQAVLVRFEWLGDSYQALQEAEAAGLDGDAIVGLLGVIAERDRELAAALAGALAARGSSLASVISRELSVGIFAEEKS